MSCANCGDRGSYQSSVGNVPCYWCFMTKFPTGFDPSWRTMRLAYKAWHPISIFREKVVRTSSLDRRDRGLSMTTNLEESGHGPFMIIFKEGCAWYDQFKPCQYGVKHCDRSPSVDPQLYKNECFRCEQEWWSPRAVAFEYADVEKVVFMADSPATRIHPRKTRKEYLDFVREFPTITVETDSRRFPLE